MTRPKPARPFVLRLAGGFVRAACRRVVPAVLAAALGACAGPSLPPIRTAASVDVDRFMGAWYVIGSIPISVEAAAHNAIERYRRDADGTIDTLYTYNDGGCRGPVARHTARGFVLDGGSGAVWGMQFIWPFKADYRIVYVAPDYGATIVGREKRDYLWIMARTPTPGEEIYRDLVARSAAEGYDPALIRRVPQPGGGCPAAAPGDSSGPG